MTELTLIAFLSYILGSVPFSWIIAKVYGKNLYEIGSKNIGAANVFRATGKTRALIMALIGDLGKGALSIYLARIFFRDSINSGLPVGYTLITSQAIAAFFVVLGHNWPIFLKFKGGRGLAALAGVILFLNWKIIFLVTGVITFFIFLAEFMMKKKISFKGGSKDKIKGLFSIFISQVVGRMIGIVIAAVLVYIFYPEIFKIMIGAAILSGIKHIKRTKTFLKGQVA